MKFVLGVDIGTTNMKAVLFGTDGVVYGQGRTELQEITSTLGISEHRLDDIWQGFVEVCCEAVRVSGVDPRSVAGIGFSAYLSGFAACDREGDLIQPTLWTWKDRRADEFKLLALGSLSESEFRERTGTFVSATLVVPRLRWLEERMNVPAERIGKLILSAKQYIIYRLLGTHHLDWECARATGLFDLAARDWHREQFARWGVNPSMLPMLHKCHEVVGHVPEEKARLLGLAPGIPVVAGGGDGLMSSIGSGVITPGTVATSIGTAAVVRAFRKEIKPVENRAVDCKILPDIGHFNSVVVPTGGLALKWYRDRLAVAEKEVADEMNTDAFSLIDAEARLCPPGCAGLLFLPPLPGGTNAGGEGHPIGSFIGVSQTHSRAHLARAIMEGIAYGLKLGVRMLQAEGHGPLLELRFAGGGARSALWGEILADTIGLPLTTLATEETAALGAAIMAGWGVGLFATLEEAVRSMVVLGKRQEPNPQRTAIYEEAASRRDELYRAQHLRRD